MKVEYTNLFMQAFDDLVSCGHHFYSQQTLRNLINEIQRNKIYHLFAPLAFLLEEFEQVHFSGSGRGSDPQSSENQ